MRTLVRRFVVTDDKTWAIVPLRLALGAIFIAHGGQKLFGWFDGRGLGETARMFHEHLGMSPGILWASLAAGSEFFGGVFVLAGLGTRLGAFLIGVTMLVAMFKVHWGHFFLSDKGIEYTLALLAMAVALFVAGGGPLSVDAAVHRRLEPPDMDKTMAP